MPAANRSELTRFVFFAELSAALQYLSSSGKALARAACEFYMECPSWDRRSVSTASLLVSLPKLKEREGQTELARPDSVVTSHRRQITEAAWWKRHKAGVVFAPDHPVIQKLDLEAWVDVTPASKVQPFHTRPRIINVTSHLFSGLGNGWTWNWQARLNRLLGLNTE